MRRRANLEGRARAVGRGGDGIVETESGVVLVPGVLPGERVEVELLAPRRGAPRGRLVRVLDASAHRITPRCPEVSRCGGCPLMAADETLQRDIKLGHLRDACHGLRGAESVDVQWVAEGDGLGYRRRARLGWNGEVFGYRRPGTRRVADIPRCWVIEPSLQSTWDLIRRKLRGVLVGSGDIQLERSLERRVVVGVSARDPQPPDAFRACEALSNASGISGVTLRTDGDGVPATWGSTTVVSGTGDDALVAPAGRFAQGNEAINRHLVDHVVRLAEPRGCRVLELHCGIGNFTVALAAQSPSVLVAVERDATAVEACRRNLQDRGLFARTTVGDANAPPKGAYDVVVLDPPRQGARALFETSGLFPGPRRIVYVSCDTSTLKRDLRIATDAGYRLDAAIGLDMFPQTAHLESVVRLVRAPAER